MGTGETGNTGSDLSNLNYFGVASRGASSGRFGVRGHRGGGQGFGRIYRHNGYPFEGTFPIKNKRRRLPPPLRHRGRGNEPPRTQPSRFWSNPDDEKKSRDAGWLGPREGSRLYRRESRSPSQGPSHRKLSRYGRSRSRSLSGSPIGGRKPQYQESDSKLDVFNSRFSSSLSLGPDEELVSARCGERVADEGDEQLAALEATHPAVQVPSVPPSTLPHLPRITFP